MSKTSGMSRIKILSALLCFALIGSTAFAKPKTESVKEEDGYYYGYGKGSDKNANIAAGKKDLIEEALTAAVKAKNSRAKRVSVSEETVKARLPKIDPYKVTKDGTTVTYRISVKDWDKEEKKYCESLRKTLTPRYEAMNNKKNMAEKLDEAMAILAVLSDNGVTDLLTLQADGTELFSKKVEAVCTDAVKSLQITISQKDGFVGSDTKYSVKACDANGKAISGLTLKINWEVVSVLPVEGELPVSVATVKTDSLGSADFDYPVSEEFKNKTVTLTVSTAFGFAAPNSAAMKKLDSANSVDVNLVHVEDVAAAYPSVKVEAGEFNAGAVALDTRAGKKEAAHTVTLAAYEIDVAPVTNAQFAAYVHATRAENKPEYFDNSDFNAPEQPVVGVTAEDAEKYAEWLSEQTGCKYRLPTEEEFEKAARAGEEIIYPWGNEAPNKGKSANYKGNGKYKFPSPVGAFDNGKNAWGLVDMAGNVWEWTSANRSETEGMRTVKGGSWMDGPTDLRISNYRDINGQEGTSEVGFRLVKEVTE